MHFTPASVEGVFLCVGRVPASIGEVTPPNTSPKHSTSPLSLLSINLVFCVSSSELQCVSVRTFVWTRVTFRL